MRRVTALSIFVTLAGIALVRGQGASAPVYVGWPLPATGGAYSSIDGKHLWQYVKEQADIAERYRDQGHPQFWGRIAGTSSDVEDVQWLLEKYQQIGLSDVHAQTVTFFNPQWAPDSWEVTAKAAGTTLKLTTAQPPYGAASTDGKVLDLPAAYVGLGSNADFSGRDVRGKAVLLLRSQFTYNLPPDVLKRAEDHGAVAVLASDLRGGNLTVQAYRATTTLPSFNLGTEDALALRDLIGQAPAAEPPHVTIRLDAKWASDQKSFLVWGTLPGATDETIYVIAHRDGWFDAAGDNASGVATMLGLAEHFAKVPQNQRRRTMIFIGTDGHHQITPGGYGREWLAANRERFFSKTAVMFNCEHPSEVLTHGGTSGWTETVIPNAWYAGGTARPRLTNLARNAFHEFGLPVWAQPSDTPPGGDIGPFVGFLPGIVVQSNDFLYMHTTGDTPENVAWSGLEAATRAYARIVDEVNKLPLSDLQRPPEPYRPRLDTTDCAAWVKDSSAGCTPRTVSNDLPKPYRTSHDWGQLPATMKAWPAVTAVEPSRDGSIYVVERCFQNSCAGRTEPPILKYDADGRLLKAWGEGLFNFPHGAAVDRDGNLWVTDARAENGKGNQVFKFDPNGKVLMTLGKAGASGSGPDVFDQPTDVVVAAGGDIFVTDSHRGGKNNRVVKFSKDGTFVKEWGRKGSGAGEMSEPHTIAIDSQGRLFVGDRENNRIQIFDQEGRSLAEWRQFGRPSGIYITADDTIYVADSESGPDTGAHELPGIRKGIRIGSARTGVVSAFIEDTESTRAEHSGAEGVGVDARGHVYGAVVRRQMLERHVR